MKCVNYKYEQEKNKATTASSKGKTISSCRCNGVEKNRKSFRENKHKKKSDETKIMKSVKISQKETNEKKRNEHSNL